MKDTRYEQGGIVSFLVIAAVLTGLLVGGILLMKRQGSEARSVSDNTVAQKDQDKKEEEKKDNTSNSDSDTKSAEGTDTANTPSNTDSSRTPTTTSPATSTTPSIPSTPATTNTTPVNTNTNSGTSTSLVRTGPSDDMTNEALPATGPVEVLGTMTAIASVSGGAYLYTQSHAKRRLSALK